MKLAVTISRIIVGVLFIFSGLIKAFDPLGLAYKMQEFFEAWAAHGYMPAIMNALHDSAAIFAMIIIALELLAGVALLIGWRKNFTLWVLFWMILFFTFLTGYALFTGEVRQCGCFGDCFTITDTQTFIKDIVLLLLIVFILCNREYIEPVFSKVANFSIIIFTLMGVFLLQSHVLDHLPVIDCLPYKKGNNILELRKMPADATFDKFDYSFVYKKGAEQKEFTMDNLPDSTWQFVSQQKKLIEKGNGKLPKINDFSLTDMNGNDSTDAILNQHAEYYLFFLNSIKDGDTYWSNEFAQLSQFAKKQNRKVYVVTSDEEKVDSFFNKKNNYNVPVYTCDGTAIKTAARSNPTLFLMNGPVIEDKWGVADIEDSYK